MDIIIKEGIKTFEECYPKTYKHFSNTHKEEFDNTLINIKIVEDSETGRHSVLETYVKVK